MADTLWKDCANWLVKCQVLPANHRVTWPDGQLIDLARTLEDGVLLCQLLHVLKPACLDLKSISLRPQMSEFLCLKNVQLFLDTCQKHFGMKPNQLFDPAMLRGLGDFFQVLECLSHLSKTQAVQARGFPYFPKELPKNQVEYYNMDSFLDLDAVERPSEETEMEDGNFNGDSTETSMTEAHIYEDLLYLKLPNRTVDELPEPKDKRDYCIRELLDTERNYRVALEMIVEKFMKPLKNVLNTEEMLTVFVNMEEIYALHNGFFSDLQQACKEQTRQDSPHFEKRLQEVFERWRMKFTNYGRFCAELPRAQRKLDELCVGSEKEKIRINEAVKKCQNEANEGKFPLRDLLSLPMQRILKYHILLKELKKHSVNRSNEDQKALDRALMIMVDVAMYINEVKRDSEMIDLIKNIEDSIVDLQMPENLHLTSYGHLHIDGVVRFRPHESSSPKTRHIFVFDRVMLIVKPAKTVFNYKDALIMDEFRVDETPPPKHMKDKWSHQWHVFNFKDNRLAYTMAVKTEAERKKWIAAIKLALDNLSPPDLKETSTHHPVFSSFGDPTLCVICDRLLRGTFFQGYRCANCKQAVHKECLEHFRDCGKPSVPTRPRAHADIGSRPSSTASMTSTISVPPSPRSDSIGTWSPPGRSDQEFGRIKRSSSETKSLRWKENFFTPHLPTSVISPTANDPISPNNPFSPTLPDRFKYKSEEEEMLSVYPWFAGHMDRDQAEDFLQRFSNGTFLVRISSKGGSSYKAISVRYDNKPRHIRILYPETGEDRCYLAPVKFFRTVPELIGWYETHSLADSFQGMNCTLRTPYKKALLPQDSASTSVLSPTEATSAAVHPRAVVRYNFSATSPNMLTIKVGDEVEILGRSGEQRGWWKGRCNGKIGYFPLSYVEEIQPVVDSTQPPNNIDLER